MPVSQLPKDTTVFVQKSGPYTDDGVGIIAKGGCILLSGTSVSTDHYRPEGVEKGGGQIQVQVATLPKEYGFAEHDFYGMLQEVMKERAKRTAGRGDSNESSDEWLFVEWKAASAPAEAVAYFCYIDLPDRPDKGFVAWYSEQSDGTRIVVIRYSGRTGLPSQVIDKYLALFPSTVDPAHYAGEGWVREDIQKWMQVIAQPSPLPRLQMMVIHSWLRRYDPESFDLKSMDAERDSPAEYRKATEQTVARMQTWLDERSEARPSQKP